MKAKVISFCLALIICLGMTPQGIYAIEGENPDQIVIEEEGNIEEGGGIDAKGVGLDAKNAGSDMSEGLNAGVDGESTDGVGEGEGEDEDGQVEPEIVPTVTDVSVSITAMKKVDVSWTATNAEDFKLYVADNAEFENADVYNITHGRMSYTITKVDMTKTELFVGIVPISGTVTGEMVTKSFNPQQGFVPKTVAAEDRVFTRNSNSPKVVVTDESGNTISSSYYSVDGPKITKPGTYKLTVNFRSNYSWAKPLTFSYKVLPPPITVSCLWADTSWLKFNFYSKSCDLSSAVVDKVYFEFYSGGSLAKTFSSKADSNDIKCTGLKSGKTYKVKAYCKTGSLKSEVTEYEFTVPVAVGTPHCNDAETKKLVSLLKSNKDFTYKFSKPVTNNSARNWCNTILNGHPQYRGYSRSYNMKNGGVTEVKFDYNKTQATKARKIQKPINSIVKGAKKKKGVKAKIKYVNSRLCKTCSYDYKAYNAHRKGKSYSTDCYTTYGCLVKHKAVCAGYAETFNAIMFQLDIPCKEVSAHNHAWNKVKVGKKWYYVDVTWNDCVKNKTKYLLKKSHPYAKYLK